MSQEIDRLKVANLRLARGRVINGERPQDLALEVPDRRGPAGAYAVLLRQRQERLPKRVFADIADDDPLAGIGGISTGRRGWPDQEAINRARVAFGQAGRAENLRKAPASSTRKMAARPSACAAVLRTMRFSTSSRGSPARARSSASF